MWKATLFAVAATVISSVTALGSTCSAPLTPNAPAGDPHWMQTIARHGSSPYNPNPSTYKVYRNVKDYGAKGDGVTDDTAAINRAISDQNRCGQGCPSSTRSPALIFFPSGTYLVSQPIIPYYLTQLVGDAKDKPTLLASEGFNGMAVIDADPYIPNGQYWQNQNNFFKSVRHFKIDVTRMPATATATGIHWQVAQATTLVDVEVDMSTATNTNHIGIYMENGSGGFMSDLTFVGGKYGIWVGNQQFTVRNLNVRNAQCAVFASWNWGWTFQGVNFQDCQIGFNITQGGTTAAQQGVGSEVIIDGDISNVSTFIQTSGPSTGSLAGSLLLDNVKFTNVDAGVKDGENKVKLVGGTYTVRQWAQGNKYHGTDTTPTYVQTKVKAPEKAPVILDSNGKIFSRGRTDYSDYSASQFASVKAAGAKGDGVTDDTAAIRKFIKKYWGCKILYFDAGTYYVTDTITIPTGSIVVGEVWTTIIGGGPKFSNMDAPKVVVKVGHPGERGNTEISDIVFSARSGSAGAIVLEWNTADIDGKKATAAMWDVHIRLGGFAGSGIQVDNCAKHTDHAIAPCTAAFLGLHITSQATAYLEGTWVWTADHDLDDVDQSQASGWGVFSFHQIDVYTGRGVLTESVAGPVWFIGTASEHHAISQYTIAYSQNVYGGFMQTETAYYQPNPKAPSPFCVDPTYHDPTFTNGPSGWSLYIKSSSNVYLYGAGFYSFFRDYAQTCLDDYTCQKSIIKVDSKSPNIYLYSISTIGTTWMLNVDSTLIINQNQNRNGFASTFTIWTSTVSTHRRRMRIEGQAALEAASEQSLII